LLPVAIALLTLRHVSRKAERPGGEEASGSAGLIVVTGLDVLIDGLVVGAGFATRAKQGLLLTIGLPLKRTYSDCSRARHRRRKRR
jgi:zinc transporter, ZIP family